MTCARKKLPGTAHDREAKRIYLGMLREADEVYEASLKPARKTFEQARVAAERVLREHRAAAKEWLDHADPNAFLRVGQQKAQIRRVEPCGIPSIKVGGVSLPRLPSMERAP